MSDNDPAEPNPWSPRSAPETPQDAGQQQYRPGDFQPAAGEPQYPKGEYQQTPAEQQQYPQGAQQFGGEPPGEYQPEYQPTAEYPRHPASMGYGGYATAPPYAIYPQPPRRSSRKLFAGMTAIALLVGGVAGGFGGYLAAEQNPTSTVNALDAPRPAKQTGSASDGTVETVSDAVLPSVVQLQIMGSSGSGEGSGFVLTDDGYILTNNHVVEAAASGAAELRVVLADGKRVSGEVVGRDPNSDVAVVKANGAAGLDPVELGRSDDLNVGQSVVAIGSPFELSGTVTSGIISSLDRPVRAGGNRGDQATVLNAVQTDAAINPGNSGGPLVDLSGRVIGINSAIYSPGAGGQSGAGNVGIGFAIPIDQARRTADEIIETGKASETYIGARVRDARDTGALIADVESDTPAEKAGLKSGDVIIKLNDRPISGADELVAAIRSRTAGEEVTLTLSGGKTLRATLGSKPVSVN
ncbi:MAG: PDZ domain-containing protein [Actinophytocola sp.]|nr:PDZ domain-containing protein [Actinophytocola sp.]